MKRYVIKSKVRFSTSMGILAITISLLFTLAVNARVDNCLPTVPQYIEAGDTLWSMSRDYAGNMDIREYISLVMDYNDLKSANIHPGDLLYFPILK